MTDSKPVFVLVTAANCGHCQHFQKNWGPIRNAILHLGSVRVIEIKLPTMRSQVSDQGYPQDLQRYIKWFPTAFLFHGKNWNDVMGGQEKQLNGLILNGTLSDPMPHAGGYPLTTEGLTTWIAVSLNDPAFVSSSKSPRDPRSALYARVYDEKRPLPTSGSSEICRQMKIKPKPRF